MTRQTLDLQEVKIYEVLKAAYSREDAAAKAAARLEADIVAAHQTQRPEPAKNLDEATSDEMMQEKPHEFDKGDFHEMFSKLNLLRMVDELIDLLELNHVGEHISANLVNDLFGIKKPSMRGMRVGATNTVIGDDKEALIASLRERAEKGQVG